MAAIEISSSNFEKMLSDVEKLYEFGVSDLDCILTAYIIISTFNFYFASSSSHGAEGVMGVMIKFKM